MTIILNKKDIQKSISISNESLKAIEEAFGLLSKGEAIMPPIMRLDIVDKHGEVDVKTAYIKGLESFAIKISPGFFNNPKIGLPTTSGMMVLLNSNTGMLEAVLLDKGYLTDLRTALAGAIASKYLAKKNISNVGIIGAGAQARFQLEALLLVKNPKEVRVWARSADKANKYISEIENKYNFKAFASKNIQEVVENSEIVITTTPSKEPLVKAEWLHPGLQITAMGSDAEHKNEIDPKIISSSDLYVCDRQSQTSILGELHHAIEKGIVKKSEKQTEIGEIINGSKKGRGSEKDIIICDLTGTGIQDTAIARLAFKKGLRKKLGLKL